MADGSLPGQAELVVARMTDALDSEELDFLTVMDNGIGLNEQRMNALLSDGVSVKLGGATGRLCCKPAVGVSQIRTTTVLSSCFCAGQTVL